jgi:hypothetical protein
MMKEHEVHRRRWPRNLLVGGLLFAFVALIFFVSIAKFTEQVAG